MTVIWLGTMSAAMTTRKTIDRPGKRSSDRAYALMTPRMILASDVAVVMITELRT